MGIGNSLINEPHWPNRRRGSTYIKINKWVSVKLTAYPNGMPKIRLVHHVVQPSRDNISARMHNLF